MGGEQTVEGHSVPGDNRGQGTLPGRQVKTSWPVIREQRGATGGSVIETPPFVAIMCRVARREQYLWDVLFFVFCLFHFFYMIQH